MVSLLFLVSYAQDRRSYYLWFYYLIFNYLSVGVFARRFWAESGCLHVFAPFGIGVFARGKLPGIHSDLWITPQTALRGFAALGGGKGVRGSPSDAAGRS